MMTPKVTEMTLGNAHPVLELDRNHDAARQLESSRDAAHSHVHALGAKQLAGATATGGLAFDLRRLSAVVDRQIPYAHSTPRAEETWPKGIGLFVPTLCVALDLDRSALQRSWRADRYVAQDAHPHQRL
jgi:hypothetical protein